jgi:hypothetical protein
LGTSVVAHILLYLPFIVLAISQKYFGLSIKNFKTIKATLNDLVGVAKKNPNSLRFAITPFSFVNRTICKKTDALAMSEIILELTFELGA